MDMDKLQGPNNYTKWKLHMRALLVLEDLWPYIETKAACPGPSATPEELDEWTIGQLKAVTMLKHLCEDGPRALIEDLENAAQAWEKLKIYKSKDWGFLYNIFRRFESLTFSGCDNDPDIYVNRFFECLSILDGLSAEPQFDENWMIHRFHEGLLPVYSTYVQTYNWTHDAFTEDGKPKFDILYATDRFLDFVRYSSVMNNSSARRPISVPEEYTLKTLTACVAAGTSELRIQKGAHSGNSRVIVHAVKYCTHCEMDYHDIDSCNVLHPELRRRPGR